MGGKYKINSGFLTQKIDGKTTVFSGEDSILHTMNDSGSYIFQGLKLGWEDAKIVEGLVKKFGAKREEAMEDVEGFKQILLGKKIIIKLE